MGYTGFKFSSRLRQYRLYSPRDFFISRLYTSSVGDLLSAVSTWLANYRSSIEKASITSGRITIAIIARLGVLCQPATPFAHGVGVSMF